MVFLYCSGPLTSFLDADQDLSTGHKYTAYSSSNSQSATPNIGGTSINRGGSGRKGAKFTDHELKVLRYGKSFGHFMILFYYMLHCFEYIYMYNLYSGQHLRLML